MIDKNRDFSVTGVALPIELENNSEVMVNTIRRIGLFILGLGFGVTLGFLLTVL